MKGMRQLKDLVVLSMNDMHDEMLDGVIGEKLADMVKEAVIDEIAEEKETSFFTAVAMKMTPMITEMVAEEVTKQIEVALYPDGRTVQPAAGEATVTGAESGEARGDKGKFQTVEEAELDDDSFYSMCDR